MRVLKYYEAAGLLQMIPWQWPLDNKQFRFSQILPHQHFFIKSHNFAHIWTILEHQVFWTKFAAPRLFAPQSADKQLHNIHRHGRAYCSCQCESILDCSSSFDFQLMVENSGIGLESIVKETKCRSCWVESEK